jgi:hypothetical protein
MKQNAPILMSHKRIDTRSAADEKYIRIGEATDES